MRFVFFWAQSSGVQGFLEGLGNFKCGIQEATRRARVLCVAFVQSGGAIYLGKKGRITYVCIFINIYM